MEKYYEDIALKVPKVLLPKNRTKEFMQKWAVIAVDQYTSDIEYWKRVEEFVKGNKSIYNLILPEIHLENNKEERIKKINENMNNYLSSNIFEEIERVIFIERQTTEGIRKGILVALDLEKYDFSKNSESLIRATEKTVVERLPPRIEIRENAPLELPHIMVLIDDKEKEIIEPLSKKEKELLYDFDLMFDSGNIKAYKISEDETKEIIEKLRQLNKGSNGLLYAMGDGNHSLATAKEVWERIKKETKNTNHPARFALVELVNLHDDSLVFEPIHRVVFNKDISFLDKIGEILHVNSIDDMKELMKQKNEEFHLVGFVHNNKFGIVKISKTHHLEVGTLQEYLDKVEVEIDYIHDDDALIKISENNIGFFLPAMDKNDLFDAIRKNGSLPRKTFSMGHSKDKRFYIEARKIR